MNHMFLYHQFILLKEGTEEDLYQDLGEDPTETRIRSVAQEIEDTLSDAGVRWKKSGSIDSHPASAKVDEEATKVTLTTRGGKSLVTVEIPKKGDPKVTGSEEISLVQDGVDELLSAVMRICHLRELPEETYQKVAVAIDKLVEP